MGASLLFDLLGHHNESYLERDGASGERPCRDSGGNAYFPSDSIKREYIRPTDAHTVCPWKGVASYYDVVVDGAVNKEAAWYYPEPKQAAAKITGYVAFWKGVEVTA